MTRHPLVRNPTILAIISSEPVLHDKPFARIECFRVNLETPLQIVGVHALSPSFPISFSRPRPVNSIQGLLTKVQRLFKPSNPVRKGRGAATNAKPSSVPDNPVLTFAPLSL